MTSPQPLALPAGPIANPSETGIPQMSLTQLEYEISQFEKPFRSDLMQMSKVLGEPAFRRYTAMCRAWRVTIRKKG